MTNARNLDHELFLQVYNGLLEKYPVMKKWLPLKLRIHIDIYAENPDIPKKYLRNCIRWHVHSTQYYQAIANGGPRYDLNCEISGEVTEEHIEMAKTSLSERMEVIKKRNAKKEKRRAKRNKVKLEENKEESTEVVAK